MLLIQEKQYLFLVTNTLRKKAFIFLAIISVLKGT
jgi:hypothetical protein